jgi:hypothetical protein
VMVAEGRRYRVVSVWCRTTRVWPRARWNATPALGAPGGSLTSGWHGRVASYGGAKTKPPRGIDSRCRGGSGGEVIERGVDGGLLALPGCPRRHGDGQVGVGWLGSVSVMRGQGRVFCRVVIVYWGSRAAQGGDIRGRGRSSGRRPRAPLLPSTPNE